MLKASLNPTKLNKTIWPTDAGVWSEFFETLKYIFESFDTINISGRFVIVIGDFVNYFVQFNFTQIFSSCDIFLGSFHFVLTSFLGCFDLSFHQFRSLYSKFSAILSGLYHYFRGLFFTMSKILTTVYVLSFWQRFRQFWYRKFRHRFR